MSQPAMLDEMTLDLIVKKAVEGLSDDEERALDLDSTAVRLELEAFEWAAAALTLSAMTSTEPLSAAMRERIEASAREFLATRRPAPTLLVSRSAAAAAAGRRSGYGWWAAAACLVLAVAISIRKTPDVALAPALARVQLLGRADSVKLQWKMTSDAAAGTTSGDLVWNPVTQQGYMRFVGMPNNDPSAHQYQLWIFDADRDQRYPVDGGVFNIPAGASEVVVPIRAALPVRVPKLFAVTLERPGGVVVSAREHILVTAQPG